MTNKRQQTGDTEYLRLAVELLGGMRIGKVVDSKAERVERILFLDVYGDRLEFFERNLGTIPGTRIEVIPEPDPGDGPFISTNRSYTNLRNWVAQDITRMTKSGEVSYVIIGNNDGMGIQRAEAVDESMRADKACVVWHDYTPGNERPYAKIGFRHFVSRKDQWDKVDEHLIKKYSQGVRAEI